MKTISGPPLNFASQYPRVFFETLSAWGRIRAASVGSSRRTWSEIDPDCFGFVAAKAAAQTPTAAQRENSVRPVRPGIRIKARESGFYTAP